MEEIIYKSITILVDSDPMNEVIHTFANMTIKRAIDIFRDENPKERGVILIYDDGKWECAGDLIVLERAVKEKRSYFEPPYKHRFTFMSGEESFDQGFNVQINELLTKRQAFKCAIDVLFERYKDDLKGGYTVYYTDLDILRCPEIIGVYNTKLLKFKGRKSKNEP